MLGVLDCLAQYGFGCVRLVLLLVELGKRASSVESDVVKALNLLTERPRLLQVRPRQVDVVRVGEQHLTDLEMSARLDFLRKR